MDGVYDSPQNKRFDESMRPIRYSKTTMFRDSQGAEWLRHEYIRWDVDVKPGQSVPIVMEYELLNPRK